MVLCISQHGQVNQQESYSCRGHQIVDLLELQRVCNLMTHVAIGFLLINLTMLMNTQHCMVLILCRLIAYKL